MNARPPTVRLVLAWLLLILGCGTTTALGDGGTVRLRQRKGLYEITVFTAPTPFRAGPVDISVLVQDAARGEPVPEARVTVTLRARGRSRRGLSQLATSTAATNKLLRAALFELPAAGWWDVEVSIAGAIGKGRGEEGEDVHFSVEAAEPLPPWITMWPWLAWPLLVVALFVVRELVVHRPIDSGVPT